MLTENGLRIKRFSDIESEINENIIGSISGDIDLSPDSFLGTFKDNYVLHESYIWELLQDVYDSANFLSAEDYLLENLALIDGHIKSPAKRTRGQCYLTYDDGYKVSSGDVIKSITDVNFLVEESGVISANSCVKTSFSVTTLVQYENYSVVVDGNVYKRDATPDQTIEEVMIGLYQLLLADGSIDVTIDIDGDNSTITVDKINKNQNMTVSSGSYIRFTDVTTPFLVISEETGIIYAKANTLSTYVNNPNILVNNPTDLLVGKNKETDFSLRKKVLSKFFDEVSGPLLNTYLLIRAIPNVVSVKIIENPNYEIASNLPPNSYKVVVYGGEDALIGEAIWKAKPSGIQPYSDLNSIRTVKVDILDFNNQSHTIYFERPDTKYIWIYVEYSKYSEELFPESGEEIIKKELAAFGANLEIGEDVFPDRFYPYVYRSVDGVGNLELYFAVTDDLNTTPSYPADYSQNTIAISDEELTNFSSTRVTVTEV